MKKVRKWLKTATALTLCVAMLACGMLVSPYVQAAEIQISGDEEVTHYGFKGHVIGTSVNALYAIEKEALSRIVAQGFQQIPSPDVNNVNVWKEKAKPFTDEALTVYCYNSNKEEPDPLKADMADDTVAIQYFVNNFKYKNIDLTKYPEKIVSHSRVVRSDGKTHKLNAEELTEKLAIAMYYGYPNMKENEAGKTVIGLTGITDDELRHVTAAAVWTYSNYSMYSDGKLKKHYAGLNLKQKEALDCLVENSDFKLPAGVKATDIVGLLEAIKQDGTENKTAQHFIYAKKQAAPTPATVDVTVIKEWQDADGNPAAAPTGVSVEVSLYDKANPDTALKTETLNEGNGWKATFTGLAEKDGAGQPIEYIVKETGTVSGYDWSVTGSMGNGFTVTNRKTEKEIIISKVDLTTSAELTGAKMTIMTIKDSKETVVSTWTSEAGNPHKVTLKPGTYTLTEHTAPEDYKPLITSVTFTIDDKGKVTVNNGTQNGVEVVKNEGGKLLVKNEKIQTQTQTEIVISKVDLATSAELTGAKMTIMTIKDSKETVVSTWTSEAGKLHKVTLEPGTYTLTEQTAPKGYKPLITSVTFTIDDEGVTVNNGTQNGVEVVKYEGGKLLVKNEKTQGSTGGGSTGGGSTGGGSTGGGSTGGGSTGGSTGGGSTGGGSTSGSTGGGSTGGSTSGETTGKDSGTASGADKRTGGDVAKTGDTDMSAYIALMLFSAIAAFATGAKRKEEQD